MFGLPSFNDQNLRRRCVALAGKLLRTRNPDLLEAPEESKTKLKRCLTTLDMTSLGVGSCVGTGMYLVAGMVAKKVAGPGVIFSFLIAAVAALFSGVCYAEFGVRVPHTTGSAYMYSYVTMGEFLGFLIGWNMILEYLIGSAACACAISACFDSLANNAISNALSSSFGTMFGRPPDIMAFAICIFMSLLLVAGVKKSLVFNNALNAINLSIWVFIMTAGLFYVDSGNWSDSGGFLPFGWSGVLTGAATCFYAFIGFDIIATTGEEATDPQVSIPRAIITSLAIIVTAYVSSSAMLTLILPRLAIDSDSGLVEMFSSVGSSTGKYIVSIGALAGLSVSLFGSMFPMPRVVYAMAKDGLIFRFLSQVWVRTGTPAVATCIFGLASAVAALIIHLDVLVEMMSIGTLLAYTLVSTCVLILRYQPEKLSLVEFLPEKIRKFGCGETDTQPTQQKVVKVQKWTPDSDEAMPSDDRDRFSRDEGCLMVDGHQKQTYGALHTSTKDSEPKTSEGLVPEWLQSFKYRIPLLFPWKEMGDATDETGLVAAKLVGLMYIFIIIFDTIIVCDINYLDGSSSAAMFFIITFLLCIIGCLLLISRKPQNKRTLKFMAPGLPFVPGVAITVNVYLILKLSLWTLLRFTVWMIIGLVVYFRYGIKNSVMETQPDHNIEMVDQQVGNSVVNTYHSFPDPSAEQANSNKRGPDDDVNRYYPQASWPDENRAY